MEPETAPSRGRLAIALGAAVVLAAIVVVVAVASGGDDASVATAPDRCVEAWNADEAALGYGRHNFSFHRYTGALVTFLTPDGTEVDEGAGGQCAVIFPSESLDPEPVAAGQVLRNRVWLPVSELEGVELTRVAELQALAAEAPNTTLDTSGALAPL